MARLAVLFAAALAFALLCEAKVPMATLMNLLQHSQGADGCSYSCADGTAPDKDKP